MDLNSPPIAVYCAHSVSYNASHPLPSLPTLLVTINAHISNKNNLPSCQLLLLSNQQAERLPSWLVAMSHCLSWWNLKTPAMISSKQNLFHKMKKSLSYCLAVMVLFIPWHLHELKVGVPYFWHLEVSIDLNEMFGKQGGTKQLGFLTQSGTFHVHVMLTHWNIVE